MFVSPYEPIDYGCIIRRQEITLEGLPRRGAMPTRVSGREIPVSAWASIGDCHSRASVGMLHSRAFVRREPVLRELYDVLTMCQGNVTHYDYDGLSRQVVAERKSPLYTDVIGGVATLVDTGDRYLSTYLYGPLGVIARTAEQGDDNVFNNLDHYSRNDPLTYLKSVRVARRARAIKWAVTVIWLLWIAYITNLAAQPRRSIWDGPRIDQTSLKNILLQWQIQQNDSPDSLDFDVARAQKEMGPNISPWTARSQARAHWVYVVGVAPFYVIPTAVWLMVVLPYRSRAILLWRTLACILVVAASASLYPIFPICHTSTGHCTDTSNLTPTKSAPIGLDDAHFLAATHESIR